MSAFFVGPETLNAAVTLVLMSEGPRSVDTLNAIGKSLWLMNAMALESRYPHEHASDYLETINAYTFEHVEGVNFATILKATECFLYQCSEGDVPEMALFKKLQAMVDKNAGHKKSAAYKAAPWGLCG